MTRVDIAIIGDFAKDKLVFHDKEEMLPGGSVYYGAIALRHIGVSVAVITKLQQDDFPKLEYLRKEGIMIFAQPAKQTSGIENIYFTDDMDQRICRPLGFAGPFFIKDIPKLEAKIFLISPIMAGEVDVPLIEALSKRGSLALDAQGFVRVREDDNLAFRDWPEKREGLAYVDFLKVDSKEAEVLTGKKDGRRAARELTSYGPKEIVLTHAKGVLVRANGRYYEAPFKPREIEGRTGRGDTCFAVYLGRRLTSSPDEACKFAAAVTSLKLENQGPFRGSITDVQ